MTNVDLKWVTYRWAALWTITNLTQAFAAILELLEIKKNMAKVQAEKDYNKNSNLKSESNLSELSQREMKLKQQQFTTVLTLIKNMGDSVTST